MKRTTSPRSTLPAATPTSRRSSAPASQSDATATPTLELLRLLWRVHHGLQSASKRMERELGVTGPQRLVVRLLDESPGTTAGALAQALHLDPGTMTGIIQRLQRDRLVRRAADPHDERRFLLALTPRGRQLATRRDGTIEGLVSEAAGKMSAADLRAAERVLESLASALLGE